MRAALLLLTLLVVPSTAVADPEVAARSACRVSIVLPRETGMLYGVVDLVAEVACPEGESAASVSFRVDGAPAGERAAPPWSVTWNAGGGFASHLVEARLTDRQGGRTSAFVLTPGAAMTETVLVASTPIDLVELSVSVTDAEGRPVRDLGRDDFVLEEEGRRQRLEEVHGENRPLSVAVLIDASSSVKACWPQLAAAAPALARALRWKDAVKVVAFNGPAYMVQDFTTDPGRVRRSPRDRRSRAEVRVWAVKALGRMGTDAVLPTLEKDVRDRSPDVAAAALRRHAARRGAPVAGRRVLSPGVPVAPRGVARAADRGGDLRVGRGRGGRQQGKRGRLERHLRGGRRPRGVGATPGCGGATPAAGRRVQGPVARQGPAGLRPVAGQSTRDRSGPAR